MTKDLAEAHASHSWLAPAEAERGDAHHRGEDGGRRVDGRSVDLLELRVLGGAANREEVLGQILAGEREATMRSSLGNSGLECHSPTLNGESGVRFAALGLEEGVGLFLRVLEGASRFDGG